MEFGLQLNPYTAGANGNAWDTIARILPAVDNSGLDSIWLYDHFLYEGGYPAHPEPEPVLECFTGLGAAAALTQRIRLGQLVVGVPYRNPALVAKMATTLDHISHGRSILGVGAGWHQREYEAYGWGQFEGGPVRLRRLEEALQVILALWGPQPVSHDGTYYQLDNVRDVVAPLQKPHPPILVGGSGEKVTLRLVAQYGQLCNVSGDPAAVGRLYQALRAHCDRLGRDFSSITRSIYTTLLLGRDEAEVTAKREKLGHWLPPRGAIVGTPPQVVEALAEYARAGCQYVIFRTPDWFEPDTIRLFDEAVLPQLKEL